MVRWELSVPPPHSRFRDDLSCTHAPLYCSSCRPCCSPWSSAPRNRADTDAGTGRILREKGPSRPRGAMLRVPQRRQETQRRSTARQPGRHAQGRRHRASHCTRRYGEKPARHGDPLRRHPKDAEAHQATGSTDRRLDRVGQDGRTMAELCNGNGRRPKSVQPRRTQKTLVAATSCEGDARQP